MALRFKICNFLGCTESENVSVAALKAKILIEQAQSHTNDKTLWWTVIEDTVDGKIKIVSSMSRGSFIPTQWLKLKL